MKLNYRRGIGILTGFLVAVSAFPHPVYAEELSDVNVSEQFVADKVLVTAEDEQVTETENWLSVAAEVITYYAENTAGMEPLITERNLRFYDVIADNNVNLSDVSYFLEIYAAQGAGMEFEGYIPKRDGQISPITTTAASTETLPVEVTTTVTTTTDVTNETTTVLTSSATTVSGTAAKETTTSATVSSAAVSSETTTTTVSETTQQEGTTTTDVVTRTPLYYGIDVSVYQGSVDWQAVKDSGVEFAIIRAGYGKHANQEDRYFDINMKNAKEAGLDCGAYWFSYALTPEDAEKEAEAFYEVIKGYKFEYPVFFDYETSDQYNLKPEQSTAIIHAFCEKMESYGYYVSLCSYVGFLNYRIESEVFDRFDTWIAHYDVKVPWYSRDYGIWQYSSTGKVPGINYDVDLNYAYYDYPSIMKECNLNGF
ncbi:MAG: glycoside hydrolase family 25 protein [Ruminococcus sp.]